MKDAELDMRMDKTRELTAKEVVNEYDLSELIDIFFKYGEEQSLYQIVYLTEFVEDVLGDSIFEWMECDDTYSTLFVQ